MVCRSSLGVYLAVFYLVLNMLEVICSKDLITSEGRDDLLNYCLTFGSPFVRYRALQLTVQLAKRLETPPLLSAKNDDDIILYLSGKLLLPNQWTPGRRSNQEKNVGL
jgi:hypothetical protein